MTISTYASLRDAVAGNIGQSWTHRGNMMTVFDTFLQLTEEEVYKGGMKSNGVDSEALRVREMETRAVATLSTSSRFLALPSGFLESRRVELEYTDASSNKVVYPLQFVVPSALFERGVAARPSRFTITSQYEFDCTPDVAYVVELQYYGEQTPISASNTTNDILTAYPSIYLYGCLKHANRWMGQEQKAEYYNDVFLSSIERANAKTKWAKIGPSPQMIMQGPTP
jgi:hypothetical protein